MADQIGTDLEHRAAQAGAVDARRIKPAKANWGRWIADCASSWCTNAWMPDLGAEWWRCEVCGLTTLIEWPPDPIAIEALLLMRPDPNTRNWEPPETLDDLLMQNVQHGILPPGVDLSDPRGFDLMETRNGYVIGGLVFGPIERWRLMRPTGPAITAAGEPLPYHPIGA